MSNTRVLQAPTEALPVLPLRGQISRQGYCLPPDATVEEWAGDGNVLGSIYEASKMALGDWILQGRERFPHTYQQFEDATGIPSHTLENYAYVARNVPVSRRREGVNHSIYYEVASLEPEVQEKFLAIAEAEVGSDVKEVTVQALRDFKSERKGKTPPKYISIHVDEHARNEEMYRLVGEFKGTGDMTLLPRLVALYDEYRGYYGGGE